MKRNFLILSWSVWDVYFSCLVLNSAYYNVEMGMMWHCAKVSCTSSHSIWLRTAFWFRSCAVGVNLCSFSNSLRKFYFITIFINTKSMGTTRHCSLVTSTPSQSTELVWVCVALGLSSICVIFTNFLMNFYFITIIRNAKSVGTTRHCSLVSSTPSQSIGLVFGCALFWCSVSFVFL